MEFRGENFFEKKIFPAPLSKNFKRINKKSAPVKKQIHRLKLFEKGSGKTFSRKSFSREIIFL